MFEFEFEGELLPFIVNGDRFELLALLPRLKPRTERDIAAAIFPFRGQPSLTAATITSRVDAMSIGFLVLGCGGVATTAMQPHPQRGGGLPPAVFVSFPLTLWRGIRPRRLRWRLFNESVHCIDLNTGAETEARVRARGRKAAAHRERRQTRVGSVEATPETTDRTGASIRFSTIEPVVCSNVCMQICSFSRICVLSEE